MGTTKQEQINEIAKYMCNVCDFKCDSFQEGMKEGSACTAALETAEAIYNAGYRKIDVFEAESQRLLEVNRQLNADYNRSLERLKSDCRQIDELKAEVKELKAELNARLTCDFVKTAQKQAQIDVLNKLKHYSHCDNFFTDGKWHRYVFIDDIEKLLEELKK